MQLILDPWLSLGAKMKARALLSGIALFTIVLFIALVLLPLYAAADVGQGEGTGEDIRGRTTLGEIEKDYQVPAVFLIERLKLPAGTSLHEPLKGLKDRHNFEIETVRAHVREYRSGTAGKPTESPRGHEHKETFPVLLILALHGLVCLVMLILLRKNQVDQKVRLAVLAAAVLLFGLLFRSQIEPVRALVQFFQAAAMGRFGIMETLTLLSAFILMTLLGVKLVCGWGCPVGALQEMLYHLPVFAKTKKRRTPFWLSNTIRILIFAVFLIFLYGWLPGFSDQSIYRFFNPFKLFEWNFTMTAPVVIAVIFAISIIYYRAYCMWICPFGLLSWLMQDVSLFRVRVNKDTCIDCGKCARACPTGAAQGIYEGKMVKADCFSCALCLTACPNGSLQYRAWGSK